MAQGMNKNTICVWYDKDAEAAARASTPRPFPTARWAPSSARPATIPSGKKGDVLVVEFTVAGVSCMGLNGGPAFKHSEAFSFVIATDDQDETDRYWNAIVGNGGQESAVRLVQGQVGRLVADHAARADRSDGDRRRRSQARLRSDDDDEEDRRRRDREGRAAGDSKSGGGPCRARLVGVGACFDLTYSAPPSTVWTRLFRVLAAWESPPTVFSTWFSLIKPAVTSTGCASRSHLGGFRLVRPSPPCSRRRLSAVAGHRLAPDGVATVRAVDGASVAIVLGAPPAHGAAGRRRPGRRS